jgi:hypothetical protein
MSARLRKLINRMAIMKTRAPSTQCGRYATGLVKKRRTSATTAAVESWASQPNEISRQ